MLYHGPERPHSCRHRTGSPGSIPWTGPLWHRLSRTTSGPFMLHLISCVCTMFPYLDLTPDIGCKWTLLSFQMSPRSCKRYTWLGSGGEDRLTAKSHGKYQTLQDADCLLCCLILHLHLIVFVLWQANGKLDRLDQLLSKLRRRYKAGQLVPKNIARHLTRIALALSMCLQRQLAAFTPIPRPAALQAPSSAPAQPCQEVLVAGADSVEAQQSANEISRTANQLTDGATAMDVDVSLPSGPSTESHLKALQLQPTSAAAARPAQPADAPSQQPGSDEPILAGSPSPPASEPAFQSPTKRQEPLPNEGLFEEGSQQQAVGRSAAEASRSNPSNDTAAAVVSAEEEGERR